MITLRERVAVIFSNIAMLDKDAQVQEGMWVGVQDDTITYVSHTAPQDIRAFGEVYDGAHRLLMPGFYNAHAHSPMTLLRGYAEGLPLDRWLNESVFPFEAKMTPEDSYWGSMLSIAEMLRYGTVSFSDMYFHTDARAKAVMDTGIKANLCDSVIAIGDGSFATNPGCIANGKAYADYNGKASGRLLVDFNIHAEYTSGPHVCKEIAQRARELDTRIHVHISETKKEHEECKQRHDGMTPVQYFESLGVFDVPVLAAHCVWLEDEDMDIMARHNAYIAANPISNMKLGSGFAPLHTYLKRGINVALGTDGAASNNNLDMMQDMFVMSLMPKGLSGDPCALSPAQSVIAATRTGACAQGRMDCGLIECGMKADLMVLDTSGPSWYPATDVLNNVVYAGHGHDVCLTMVDGCVLYRDGQYPTLDIERVTFEVAQRSARIISEL